MPRPSCQPTALLLLCVTALVACGSGSGSDEPPLGPWSPLTSCNTRYRCDHEVTQLRRDSAGRCMFFAVELAPDGTVRGMKDPGSWTADEQGLTLCVASDCGRCVSLDAPPPPPSAASPSASAAQPAPKCTGTPTSCPMGPPCGSVRGCSMVSHVNYDGTYTNTCEGTPDDCKDMDTVTTCVDQGCRWQ